MASLCFIQIASLPRWHSNWTSIPSINIVQLQELRMTDKWAVKSVSKSKATKELIEEDSDGEPEIKKKTRRVTKRTSTRGRKKAVSETALQDDLMTLSDGDVSDKESLTTSGSTKGPKKSPRTRRKAAPTSSNLDEEPTQKKVTRRRRSRKPVDDTEDPGSETEDSNLEGDTFLSTIDDNFDEEFELEKDGGEDISFTYGWPPLVCCFGAAQHAFVPSGRRGNRLIDYKIHERMKDAMWAPEKFVRAPGGCSSNVAVALASLGGKVAFMGKLGDDDYGQSLLYFLNVNNVQTRAVRLDSKRVTAISQMKLGKRGGLRMTTVKPCAEDSLSKSEINIDVLKEAKMFYFNTFSLLDRNMRSTTIQAIKISKKLGGVVFYDLNLPMPLWQSSEETKSFIRQAWSLADIIEVTKQELEFLCGISPSERFDTKDNDRTKFTHYAPELIAPLWHDNLKVLFVTNGTSKVHYYTNEQNGAVHGMEDAPLTPFTSDMSASGDGIVAGLMRMLTVQPHLITDKGYLEHAIKYAINCGVIDQWLQARTRGFPPKEGTEEGVLPDPNGIKSISEREFRTLVPVS